jgi:hypothetical protein
LFDSPVALVLVRMVLGVILFTPPDLHGLSIGDTVYAGSQTNIRMKTAQPYNNIIIIQPLASGSRLEDPCRQELVDLLGIVLDVGFQRKVPRVDKPQHQVLHITSECFGAGLDEDVVVRAPESEYWHATRAEVLLPLRIEVKIRTVVVEQGQLYLRGALACEQGRVERVPDHTTVSGRLSVDALYAAVHDDPPDTINSKK